MYTVNKLETFRPAHRWRHGSSRVLLILCLLCAINAAMPSVCLAADNHYIRDGGDNNKSGNDWNEAWDDLPATLIRGDTYYVADGDYAANYVFDDAADGTKTITIKKAIEADHGTDTGWDFSFGDGQAVWELATYGWDGVSGRPGAYKGWHIIRPYYIIDGQVGGGPGNWDGSQQAYGFKVCGPADLQVRGGYLIVIGNNWTTADNADYLELHHVKSTQFGYCAATPNLCTSEAENCGGFNLICSSSPGLVADNARPMTSNVLIDHCYFSDTGRELHIEGCTDWTIEYCYIGRNYQAYAGSGGARGMTMLSTSNITFRYNYFHNIFNSTGAIPLYCSNSSDRNQSVFENIELYGNVFQQDTAWSWPNIGMGLGSGALLEVCSAITGADNDGIDGLKIYNNSFVNIFDNVDHGGQVFLYFQNALDRVDNVHVANNMFYKMEQWSPKEDFIENGDYGNFDVTTEYNWYYDIECTGADATAWLVANESNGQQGSGDPFIDWETNNFTLTDATTAGVTLPSPYNQDMYGNTRGGDGVWDRGAIEYVSGSPDITPPTIISVTVHSPVYILFSEPLDVNSATNVQHYKIEPNITIYSATLEQDLRTVVLTTSAHSANVEYTLTVNGVKDVAGNTMVEVTHTYQYILIANAGSDQTVTDTDGNGSEQVTLDGSASSSPYGTIVSWAWTDDLGDTIPDNETTTATLSVGTHTITLTVTDDDGATDTDTVIIVVNPGNQAPSADAGADQTVTDDNGNGSESVTLDASDSGDSDGNIVSWVWNDDLGDTIPDGETTTATLSVGTHTITLTVTDDDGGTDTDTVIITVNNVVDTTAPSVSNCSPAADAIQVPLNSLIILHITDAGIGVDADLVTIEVNGNPVYTGNTTHYSSTYGECYRIGTKADYKFIYQSEQNFEFDQSITITVNAKDLVANRMDPCSYSFDTEMRSFGENKMVNSSSDGLNKGSPATVRDNGGNIWAAWHAGPVGSRDIYVGKLANGADSFGTSIQLTNDASDQYNPAVALTSNDRLYVAWQDNRRGNWDIYVSTSMDGTDWSAERRVTDSNDNQVNPAIVISRVPVNQAHIVWQDDRGSNQDIYYARSNNRFVTTTTLLPITSDPCDQIEPAIAADSDNNIYVVWTDTRNSKNDIYGAASSDSWTNVAIVNNANNQSNPAIATESEGSILHLVWVDDTPGDNNDIFYAKTTGGLGPLTGSSIINEPGADQLRPVIAVAGSTTNSNLHVFACWQDERDADDDLYLVEIDDLFLAKISSGDGVNVFVDDDSTNTDQTEPAIGIDVNNHPYLVWTDSRNTNTDIYYAGSTYIEPTALASGLFKASDPNDTTVGNYPPTNVDDVSVVVPAGAYPCDITITISKITNPLASALQCLGAYDFGPSGIEFSQSKSVTVTIPYNATESATVAYWYNSLTDSFSQQGITDVEIIVVVPQTLHALRFKTTHFTPFYVFLVSGAAGAAAGGGGGGGGCSMSPNNQDSIVELLLPYIGLTVVMVILKLRDRRKSKALNITKN